MVITASVLTAIYVSLLQQTSAGPAQPGARTEWTGCLQAGSTPSAFRLNLDDRQHGTAAPNPPGQGEPYVQLLAARPDLDFATFVGKRVRVKGRTLTKAEAEAQAVRRPDAQESNESAAGTGGPTQRHFTYVRVESVASVPGACR